MAQRLQQCSIRRKIYCFVFNGSKLKYNVMLKAHFEREVHRLSPLQSMFTILNFNLTDTV